MWIKANQPSNHYHLSLEIRSCIMFIIPIWINKQRPTQPELTIINDSKIFLNIGDNWSKLAKSGEAEKVRCITTWFRFHWRVQSEGETLMKWNNSSLILWTRKPENQPHTECKITWKAGFSATDQVISTPFDFVWSYDQIASTWYLFYQNFQ